MNEIEKEYLEETARIIWNRFCGFPITEPYMSEYNFLLETLERLNRAAFTLGLHDGLKQGKDRGFADGYAQAVQDHKE